MVKHTFRSAVPWATVGTYIFFVIVILILWHYRTIPEDGAIALVALLLVYLGRFLSLTYKIEDGQVKALRLFGSRREPLSSVRKVEVDSLRNLSPVSMLGGWGWRSRMWSPHIGAFDNLSTIHQGVIVYADGAPFFISPKDIDGFLKQLDESCGGKLLNLGRDEGPLYPAA